MTTAPAHWSDLNTGFILAEDAAMKDKVSGCKVPTAQRGVIDVPTRFRYPESERNPVGDERRKAGITYPMITIDMVAISYDAQRDHAGNVNVWNIANESYEVTDDGKPGLTEYPLPVRLQYRVTTWATAIRHHRSLQAQMLAPNRLPMRHGWLYIPVDNTRRLLWSQGVADDSFYDTSANQRILRSVFTVSVESEMLKTEIATFRKVTNVIIDPPTHGPDSLIGVN